MSLRLSFRRRTPADIARVILLFLTPCYAQMLQSGGRFDMQSGAAGINCPDERTDQLIPSWIAMSARRFLITAGLTCL